MRYAAIINNDTANGPGLRVSLFTQGCNNECEGCHNQELWDSNGGKQYTEEAEQEIIQLLKSPYIKGLSILGGEPLLYENLPALCSLVTRVKELNKDIWLWTGYTYEQLLDMRSSYLSNILHSVDILVDGPYIKSQNPLKYRGSANQRIIDMKQSLNSHTIVSIEI